MTTPETSAAALEQATAVGSTPAPKAPTAKTAKTPQIFTDERGSYTIGKVRKPDGTIGKVKRRIPASTDSASPKAMTENPSNPTIEATTAKSPLEAASTDLPGTEPLDRNLKSTDTPVVREVKPEVKNEDKTAMPKIPKTVPETATTNPTLTKSAKTSNVRRLLLKLGGHITQTAAAFNPDWDLGEDLRDMRDDDEPIDDTDDDTDDDRYESDDERADSQNSTSTANAGSSGNIAGHGISSGLDEIVSNTGNRALLDAAETPAHAKTFGTTILEKDKLMEPVEYNEKTPYTAERPTRVSGTGFLEKDIKNGDSAKIAPPPTRQPLQPSKTSIFIRITVWSILIIFPCLFILLGILAAVIAHPRRKQDDPAGVAVTEAIKIAITAWPIVFAAIIAQSLKTLATWRVERGIKLMNLEQLISSHSVSAAIKQPFFMRQIDIASIGLLALWSLSPITSQAMQRMSHLVPGISIAMSTVTYVDTTKINLSFDFDVGQDAQFAPSIDIMYGAALAPQDHAASGADTFNNPLIPTLILGGNTVTLPGLNNTEAPSDGWTETKPPLSVTNDNLFRYSSIFGIPFQNGDILANGTTEMEISTSYLNFSCTAPQLLTWSQFFSTISVNFDAAASGTLYIYSAASSGSGTFDFASVNLNVTAPTPSGQDQPNCNTTIQNGYQTSAACANSTLFYSTCSFNRTYVDSRIHCTGISCSVSYMRPTPGNPFDNSTMGDIAGELVKAEPRYTYGNYTITEQWLYDNTNALDLSPTRSRPDFTGMSADVFSRRLGLLVNTYWQVGYSPIHIADGIAADDIPKTYITEYPAYTSGYYTDTRSVYAVRNGWVAVLFIGSFFLLVFGIGSAIFETLTVGPDVLGFASSIVRQSKYVHVDYDKRGGSTMSGVERSRVLGDTVVMMQDVRPDREIGRIALGTINENSKPLRADRYYR